MTSKYAGLGKTWYIKECEKTIKPTRIFEFFPITGTLCLNEIGQRFSSIKNLHQKNLAI